MIPPCKDCDKRELGCHGKCEKYAEFREGRERAHQRRCEDVFAHEVDFESKMRGSKIKQRAWRYKRSGNVK